MSPMNAMGWVFVLFGDPQMARTLDHPRDAVPGAVRGPPHVHGVPPVHHACRIRYFGVWAPKFLCAPRSPIFAKSATTSAPGVPSTAMDSRSTTPKYWGNTLVQALPSSTVSKTA